MKDENAVKNPSIPRRSLQIGSKETPIEIGGNPKVITDITWEVVPPKKPVISPAVWQSIGAGLGEFVVVGVKVCWNISWTITKGVVLVLSAFGFYMLSALASLCRAAVQASSGGKVNLYQPNWKPSSKRLEDVSWDSGQKKDNGIQVNVNINSNQNIKNG